MMTALFIFGSMSVLGLTFVIAAGVAASRPMPEFEAAGETSKFDVYTSQNDRSHRPALLMPVASH